MYTHIARGTVTSGLSDLLRHRGEHTGWTEAVGTLNQTENEALQGTAESGHGLASL